jgi:hypothetical protein
MYIELTQGAESILINISRIVRVQQDGTDSILIMTDGNAVSVDESYSTVKTALAAEPLVEVTGDNGLFMLSKMHVITATSVNSGADSSVYLMTGENLALDETFSELTTLLA